MGFVGLSSSIPLNTLNAGFADDDEQTAHRVLGHLSVQLAALMGVKEGLIVGQAN